MHLKIPGHRPSARQFAIGVPYVWLALFLLVPFLLVLKISFSDLQFGIPPYMPIATLQDQTLSLALHLRGYVLLFTDSLYAAVYLNSVKMALVTTVCCALIGYPMAYHIARARPEIRNILLLGVILPFWTSLLLRVYAWVGILRNDGLLNHLLMGLGLIDAPLEIYRTDLAVCIGLVYAYLPFFILPLYANLVKLDHRGMMPVLTVHDEAVTQLLKRHYPTARLAASAVLDVMLERSSWAEGLPLAAEASADARYTKGSKANTVSGYTKDDYQWAA